MTQTPQPALVLTVPTAEDMVAVGRRLASLLRAGDLVLLTGDLGAGKTTLTRGLGEGLGAQGAVTSPTFVIARVHRAPQGRPPLVHVDAYRLSSVAEVDDLDLDASLEDSVTVVEWGEGKVEGLADHHLRLAVRRSRGAGTGVTAGGVRTVEFSSHGARWADVDLAGVLRAAVPAAPGEP